MASQQLSFRLPADFVQSYLNRPSPFGFNGLGELVYQRTYSRVKSDGSTETWPDTVERVVNGAYTMQKDHVLKYNLGWDEEKGQKSAREMYDRIFNLKFTPPGRGLWTAGTDAIFKRGLAAALNNCAFVSTENIDVEHSKPFRFLMDMSMLGVGVGFDTKGAGKTLVRYPATAHHPYKFEKIGEAVLNGMVLNRCHRYMNALERTLREKNPEKSDSDIKVILDKYLYTQVARTVGQQTTDVSVAVAQDTLADYDEEIADLVDKRVYQYVMQVLIDKLNETITKAQAQIAALDADDDKVGSLQWTISSSQNDITMYRREIEYVDALGDRKVKFVDIDDDREGWVDSLTHLVDSYLKGGLPVIFVYSKIRPAGLLLKTFGGLSSGPEPLIDMHLMLRQVFERNAGRNITVTTIVDVMNLIGKAVVAGNVRRSSEIALGEPNSAEFLNLKNYAANPERAAWGWCSNNSLYAEVGMDYTEIARRINDNGEPGLFWLENARDYSRMGHAPDFKDKRAAGTNPCSEQTLESYELCCLVEVFPARHENLKDFLRTLKFAYLYAKTVTLGNSHWAETNRVMMRNRRIGCSLSGIAQFMARRSLHELREWCQLGYDEIQNWDRIYSEYLAIPRSVKTTSIKPSGSVSLLAGATPGVHFPISRCYIRRMRLMKDSHLVKPLLDAGYVIEPCVGSEKSTVVVEIPIKLEDGIRTCDEVSVWEKMELTAFIQEHWADNQVSVTVDYDLATEGAQIKSALEHFQYRMKSVSFLPRKGKSKPYPQMPYESIDEDTYRQRIAKLRPLNFAPAKKSKEEEVEVDNYCDGDKCTLSSNKRAKHDTK